ncbi:MAG: DUF2341 domain-containing protein [Actinobacteria bacterium]|nr:DUF2341 domain-containing protein [Actinomycetota bacterium]
MKNKKIKLLSIIVIFLSTFIFFYFQQTARSEWLEGFKFRYPIEVEERSGSDLYDQQVKIYLNSNFFDFSQTAEDGRDLRFVDEYGNMLSYWIEKWPDRKNTTEAIIWVKIPKLNAHEKKKIYMYYGNDNASSYSNLTSTMDLIEVIQAKLGKEPKDLEFSTNPDIVISSPAYVNDGKPVTVYAFKDGNGFKASIARSSLDITVTETVTAYFLGIKSGRFSFNNVIFEATTQSVDSFVSNYVSRNACVSLFNGSKENQLFYFASVFSQPMENAQLGLLQPIFKDYAHYGSSMFIRMESDNTTSAGSSIDASLLKVETRSSIFQLFDASKDLYREVDCLTTTTAQKSLTLPFSGVCFISLNSDTSGSAFPVISSTEGMPNLLLLNDPTSNSDNLTTLTVSVLSIREPGIFAVAKKAPVDPLVKFKKIEGRVFEDENLNARYDKGERVFEGARVRLYEDVDENDTLSTIDRFVAETVTDENGIYSLPALNSRNYLVCVSSASCGESVNDNENTISNFIPEEYFANGYIDGKLITYIKPGGEDPIVSDFWSEETDPAFNIYEHITPVHLDDSEYVSGIDFGFSFTLVVNTYDSLMPSQGSLRQAITNANALPGKQSIRFYLTRQSGNYIESLDEFYINLKETLPDIVDSILIDGNNLNHSMASSTVILRGTENSLKYCLNVLSPGTEIQNLKISGFEKGIVFSVPQYERVISAKDPDSSNSLRVNSDLCESLMVINAKDLSSVPFAINKSLVEPTSTLVIDKSKSFGDLRIVQRKTISDKAILEANTKEFSIETFLPSNEKIAAVSGKSFSSLDFSNVSSIISPYSSKIFEFNKPERFYKRGELSIISERGCSEPKRSFASKKLLIPLPAGFQLSIFPYQSEIASANATFYFGMDVYSTSEVTLPLNIESNESERAISIESESALSARIKNEDDWLYIPPADTKLFGVFRNSLLVCSESESFISVYGRTEDGKTFNFEEVLEPGIIYDLTENENLKPLKGKLCSAFLISSKPIVAFGSLDFNNDSSVAFVPESYLATKFWTTLKSDTILIAAFSPTNLTLKNENNSRKLFLQGTLMKPDFLVIKENLDGFEISSDSPIFVIYREALTGKFTLANTTVDYTDFINPNVLTSSKYAFDSACRVTNVSFLACNTAVKVDEGTGVELTKNRYVNCAEKIDIGNFGKEPIDNSISIDEPNLGVDSPRLTAAIYEEPTLTISGYVGSTESAIFDEGRVEIYLSDNHGNPTLYLGETEVSNGSFKFEKKLDALKPSASDFVVATFIFKDGSTSEFSEAIRIDPAPIISEVKATHISPLLIGTTETLSTTITWYTDIPATSKVVYDTVSHASTETYSFETTETTELVTTHSVTINGLSPNTIYYFRVISKNEYGDESISYEFMIPPGKVSSDSDLCAACHRAHTGIMKPLRLPYYVRK